jgi:hypothetical protein
MSEREPSPAYKINKSRELNDQKFWLRKQFQNLFGNNKINNDKGINENAEMSNTNWRLIEHNT